MLADTHVVIWSSFQPEEIARTAESALVSAHKSGEGICIASATLWEIAMLVSRGKVLIPHSLDAYLRQVEARFRVLPTQSEIAERSVAFSKKFPKDPTDRIIAATAIVHGMPLITADKRIRRSGEVPCIW